MSACRVFIAAVPRPVPCGRPATGYWYAEALQTITPACAAHRNRTTWLEEVTP